MAVLINDVEIVPKDNATEEGERQAESPASPSPVSAAVSVPDLDEILRQRHERLLRLLAH